MTPEIFQARIITGLLICTRLLHLLNRQVCHLLEGLFILQYGFFNVYLSSSAFEYEVVSVYSLEVKGTRICVCECLMQTRC